LEKEVKLATLLPLRRLCELAQVSRAGFYRWRRAVTPVADDMELRDDIQRVALEFPYYGWRRVTAELRRRGWTVNHKRVRRIMREDNLLCLRRRKFAVTTDSDHSRPVYPNLATQLELSGINRLWIADITYIRLEAEFIYLAVVIDAFSRRVIGWALERTIEDDLALAALRVALEERGTTAGLVHHSDRGSQYASTDYTDLLKASGIAISMSHKASPWEKDYASYCTSWALCGTTSFRERRLDNFTPCALRGGWSPGCSNRQSFLSLYECPRSNPWRFQMVTRCGVTPRSAAISSTVSMPALRNRS
jgi:transposase InsO family protein